MYKENGQNSGIDITSIKKVYVISKYAGDFVKNVVAAVGYCKQVIDAGFMPIASHLLYPQMLDDTIPEQRALGTAFCMALLSGCEEAWCFGKNISAGMAAEL